MRALILCTCLLMCASFISTELVGAELNEDLMRRHIVTCMIKNNVTQGDMFHKKDIETEVYNQPEMQEKRQKNGCFLMCALKKLNLMDGTEFKEETIREMLPLILVANDKELNEINKHLHDCIQETKDVTPECEKVFVTAVCFAKNLHRMREAAELLKNNHENSQEEHQTV